MPNATERISVTQYRAILGAVRAQRSAQGAAKPRRTKYGNRRTASADGADFDSAKEARTAAELELAKLAVDPAQRVVHVARQQRFTVIERQQGERRACYIADFVATFEDGHVEVIDTKSEITRTLPAYVLKRKLMLQVHGVRIREA